MPAPTIPAFPNKNVAVANDENPIFQLHRSKANATVLFLEGEGVTNQITIEGQQFTPPWVTLEVPQEYNQGETLSRMRAIEAFILEKFYILSATWMILTDSPDWILSADESKYTLKVVAATA